VQDLDIEQLKKQRTKEYIDKVKMIKLNTCKTCKWWDKDNKEGIVRLGQCEQPKAKIGYRYSEADIEDDGVWVENDEGWAWFMGPDFGCVNHEMK
jgi:hypothetical protein